MKAARRVRRRRVAVALGLGCAGAVVPEALAQSLPPEDGVVQGSTAPVAGSTVQGSGAGVSLSASAQVSVPATTVRAATDAAGAALVRLPLRVGVGLGLGYISQLEGVSLDGSSAEFSGTLGVVATPWLSIEARAAYLSAMRRVFDRNADGRSDRDPGALTAFHGSLGARFRFLEDYSVRQGWSLGLGVGYLHPLTNHGAHSGGFTLDAAVARHLGTLTEGRFAYELGLELRGRSGLGPLGDLQQLQLGLTGAWEGDQDPRRSRPSTASSGYRPGHTFGVELAGAIYPGDGRRQGTSIELGGTGGAVSLAGGLILARPFELVARAGYMARSSKQEGADYLHGVLLEGGTRFRWGWAFAELDGGVIAPFGTLRDRVETTVFAGGALGTRFAFGPQDQDGWRLLLSARTRIGVMGEHAFDALLLSVGLEWEGGQHAPPFPRIAPAAPPPPEVRVSAGAGAGASGSAGAGTGTGTGTGTGGSGGEGAGTGTGTGTGTGGSAEATGSVRVETRGPYTRTLLREGPTYSTVPLSVGLGFNYGYIAPLEGHAVEHTVGEASLTLSWTPAHWLAIDARAAYGWAAARTEDHNRDGVNDLRGEAVRGVQLSVGPRLRLMSDRDDRQGWSFGLLGGYWFPTGGFTRGGGFTLETVVARHVGTISSAHNAFGLSLELRGRTGLGDLGDLHTLTLGAQGWWEGNVSPHRTPQTESRGWRPGHTFAFDMGAYGFFDGGRRANGVRYFGDAGYGVGLSGGLVLAPMFELGARIGYLHRAGEGSVNGLAAFTTEAGPRVRYGWLSAQGFAGYAAVFGTHRDEVASGAYAGFTVQARPEVSRRWQLLIGLTGRVGLGEERALDHLGIELGFEFEGGAHRAPAFPAPPPRVVTAPTGSNTTVQGGTDLVLPPVYGPRTGGNTTVQGGSGGTGTGTGSNVSASGSASVSGPVRVDVPLRLSAGVGRGFNSGGVLNADLDGAHSSVWFGAAWVPTRWFALELNGAYLGAGGHRHDANRDGRADGEVGGLTGFAATLGARFRALRDEEMRYGWSFGVGGGVLMSSEGTGPLGELVLGRHVGTLGDSHMSFEVGVEARARLAWLPGTATGGRGNDFESLTVGLTGAWEAGVRGESGRGVALGETLQLEAGYAFFLWPRLRNGVLLESSGTLLGVRTGLVFSPGFELSARAAWMTRAGGEQRDGLDILLAEVGPRFRWGWMYGEIAGGYAGGFGTHRDTVAGSPLLGLGLGARLGLTGPGRHWGLLFGVHGRAGLSEERSYDQLVFSVGVEFEGGRQQAAPFPAWLTNAFRTANTARAAGPVQVGVAVSARPAPRAPLVLGPGFTYEADPVGRAGALELTTDEVQRELPTLTDRVRRLRITVSAPSGVNGAALESMVQNAVRIHYRGKYEVNVRVIAGARRDRFALTMAAE